MYCPNCGTKIEDGSRYCEFCGTKLYNAPNAPKAEVREEPDAPHTYVAQPKKKSGLAKGCLIAAVIVLVVLAVIVGVVIHFTMSSIEEYFTEGLSEEEYKASCTAYSYGELIDNADALEGERVKVEGVVLNYVEESVLGKTFGGYLISASEEDDSNVMVAIYISGKGKQNISTGDRVIVWGELSGQGTGNVDSGDENPVPTIFAPYIELKR